MIRDHFLALDPIDLTVDLLEKNLLVAETSIVAVGAARGTPRTPLFEGCSPSHLAPSYAFAAAIDILGAEDSGFASTLSGKRRNSKGKGGKNGGGGSGGGGGVGSGGGGGGGGGGSGGSGGRSGGFGGGSGGTGGGGGGGGGSSGSGGGGNGGGRGGAVQRGGSGGGHRRQHWAELLRSGVYIFALNYDAILAAMNALSVTAEGDYYLCVPPELGIEAVALGASESALPSTAPGEALHTFTLESAASRCFFRDSLHLPSFSTNLVSTAALQDAMVTSTTPRGQRVSICTCTRTGRHLATFTRRPGSSLYTLNNEPLQVAASSQVSTSGPVVAPCSCRLLSHQTLLWHHHLGHPSLPRLCGTHSRLLVYGLPRSLPPLLPSPAPPNLPCIEGVQRAAPHSSSFPLTIAPLQTLHMDSVSSSASGSARTFLSCVCTLSEVVSSPPTSCGNFCRWDGILQSFTLSASPQQNGIAERRIGLVMEVARTSMIQAAAPHFIWPFAVRYAAHQLNLWPRVSLPETLPTLHWTCKVGNASVFRVWGCLAFVRDTSADKLSSRAIPCVFLGFPPDAPGWQFYHPTSCHVLPSQDVTFDESVPFYHLFPYRSAPLPPLLLFLAPGPPPVAVESGAARGAASGGAASGGAEPVGAEPRGAEYEGAESGGAERGGVEHGGTEPEGAEPGGAESEGTESGVAEPWGAMSARGPTGAGGSVARGTGASGTGATILGSHHTVRAEAKGHKAS
ncbi:unnamed protein product [Closterium sp. NIES-54]